MPPTIPVELYRGILVYIADPPTLFSLLTVSRDLNREAERILYCSIVLYIEHARSIRLLQRLISAPRVAQMVQRVDIVHYESDGAVSLTEHLRTAALRTTALCALANLHTLTTHSRHLDPCDPAAPYPFRLREYHTAHAAHAAALLRFLARQPALERLALTAPAPVMDAAPTLVPRLRVLQGFAGALLTFLPDRRVECVRWRVHPGEDIAPLVPEIAAPLRRLRALAVIGTPVDGGIACLAGHLAELQFLELGLAHSWKELAGMLPKLPCLRGVAIGAADGEEAGDAEGTGAAGVARSFDAAPALRFIEVALSGGRWERWERGMPMRVVREPHEWTEAIA